MADSSPVFVIGSLSTRKREACIECGKTRGNTG
jgi:hypothetical protein